MIQIRHVVLSLVVFGSVAAFAGEPPKKQEPKAAAVSSKADSAKPTATLTEMEVLRGQNLQLKFEKAQAEYEAAQATIERIKMVVKQLEAERDAMNASLRATYHLGPKDHLAEDGRTIVRVTEK